MDRIRAAQPGLHFQITAILGHGDLITAASSVERRPGTGASQLIWLIRLQGDRMAEMWTFRGSP